MTQLCLCLIALFVPQQAGASEKPRALVEMEQARAALQTGHVIWSTVCNLPHEDDDISYRWHSWDLPRYFESRFASDEYLVDDEGDPRGVARKRADGTLDDNIGYRPQSYLFYDGAQWEYRPGDVSARVLEKKCQIQDVRALGLTTSGFCLDGLGHLFDDSSAGKQYETRQVGGLYEVTVRNAAGDAATEYVIDPKRGWNAVRVAYLVNGEVQHESRTELQQIGDVWFPERVEAFDRSYKGGTEPTYVFTVHSATFNEPDQPRHLTPADIGVDKGMVLEVHGEGYPVKRESRDMYWDGQKVISEADYSNRLHAGEQMDGPRTQAALNRSYALGYDLGSAETMMEAYVRRFIERYQLNDDQAKAAWRVLRDCQGRAQQYLSRNKSAIDETRAAVRKLDDPTVASSPEFAGTLAKLRDRMLRLRAPMDEIFYGQLVPRLEKLPTRAQRAAAAKRETEAAAGAAGSQTP